MIFEEKHLWGHYISKELPIYGFMRANSWL